jgi:hypothetical protein
MPGAPDRETPIPVRRFQGTMLAMDPAFVPPAFLTWCDNWIPDPTFVLTKRLGSHIWQTLPGGVRVDPLAYTHGSDGHRYLYACAAPASGDSGGATLYLSVDDAPFVAVPNGKFATAATRTGFAFLGDTVFFGNDSDPVKQIPLGGTAIDLVQVAIADDTGATAVMTDDPNSNLIAGTYSYRWGALSTTTQRWTKLAPTRTITTQPTSRARIVFRAPTGGLVAGEAWHLFVAGADQMIEGAHDQTPNGLPVSTGADQFSLYDDPSIDGTAVPIPSTVTRRGSHLVAHRGCLWGAGGVGGAAQMAWCTSVIVPGTEQTIFNQGTFFPAAALTRDLGDPVSGLAVVPQSSGNMQPAAPLAIFTPMQTWLCSGDMLNDPSASLVQMSGEVGCPSDRTIVATPVGVIFGGKRSVYLLSPAAAEPRDIGWPIESAIRAIPSAARARSWAVFHRGFYKLAITSPGGIDPTVQWWLDLRRGLGDPPAWWGPHTVPAYTASTRAPNHPQEDDRQWAALGSTVPAQVLLLDQADTYIEDGNPPVPIVSRARTASLDAGAPLVPKLAKRVRVVARVSSPTAIVATVMGDHATSATGILPLTASGGGVWNQSDWNTAIWVVSGEVLAEWELPVPEIRARTFQTTLAHTDAMRCDFRDFELRVQPSARETR